MKCASNKCEKDIPASRRSDAIYCNNLYLMHLPAYSPGKTTCSSNLLIKDIRSVLEF